MPKTTIIRVCHVCRGLDKTQPGPLALGDRVLIHAAAATLPRSSGGAEDPLYRYYVHPRCLGMKEPAA